MTASGAMARTFRGIDVAVLGLRLRGSSFRILATCAVKWVSALTGCLGAAAGPPIRVAAISSRRLLHHGPGETTVNDDDVHPFAGNILSLLILGGHRFS